MLPEKKRQLKEKIHFDLRNHTWDDEFTPSKYREKMMDKTIADSFPASDPPSSLPDPNEDSFSREIQGKSRRGKTKQLTITT